MEMFDDIFFLVFLFVFFLTFLLHRSYTEFELLTLINKQLNFQRGAYVSYQEN